MSFLLPSKQKITNVQHNHFSSKLHIYVYKVKSSSPQSLIPSTFLHRSLYFVLRVRKSWIYQSINITINQSIGVKLVVCAQAPHPLLWLKLCKCFLYVSSMLTLVHNLEGGLVEVPTNAQKCKRLYHIKIISPHLVKVW